MNAPALPDASVTVEPEPYHPDASIGAKLRRKWLQLERRRPLGEAPRGPMVSFSFDDPARSATTVGAQILEAEGVRATYYIAADLLGRDGHLGAYADWDDLKRLVAAGHELGCHTYGHSDCARLSVDEIGEEIARNAAAFAQHGLPPARTFAYPFGEVTGAAKSALEPHFGLLRAVHKGVLRAGTDLDQAPAVPLEGADPEGSARTWLAQALKRRAWLIFYTHDVVQAPSAWGCTPAALTAVVKMVKASGAAVVTVAEGLDKLGLSRAQPAFSA